MTEKKKVPYFVFLILIFFLTLSAVYWYQSHHYPVVQTAGLYDHLGGDFTLQHKSGKFSLKNLQGKPSILYFGFTSCPDVCPLSLNKLNKVLDEINPKVHSSVNKVFISVDYKRDNSEKVDEYGKYFSEDFISLAGNKEQIEDITKKYAVHFEFVPLKDSALEYTVDHTSRFFLLDSEGKIVNSYSDITNDPAFKKQLKSMVKL
ncbi:MAG: SCO family protein [Halobacteriovoraceae bacterium]|nr:SCO family protein [Halobacteriovoraceae bacterium]